MTLAAAHVAGGAVPVAESLADPREAAADQHEAVRIVAFFGDHRLALQQVRGALLGEAAVRGRPFECGPRAPSARRADEP